jgi:two-component system phosphate regulon sensor histidine kinase PhoR
MSIRTKLTLLLLILCTGVIAGSGIFSTISLERYFQSRLIDELSAEAAQTELVVRNLAEYDPNRYIHMQAYMGAAKLRLTLIDAQGTVLFESDLRYNRLPGIENHLQRPEVQAALRSGTGTATRHSATLDLDELYLAKRVAEPFPQATGFGGTTIVRIGVPLTQVNVMVSDIRSKIIITSVLILCVVIAVTVVVSRRLARPIKEMADIAQQIRAGNLEKRIPIQSSDEFARLAESLNSMMDRLNEDISMLRKLERVRTEFLGNVSHELRTPIFAVQSMLETLLHGALEDPAVRRDFVERALANTERLNMLLGDLIEISRIETGDMKMSFRYFPIRDFLSQVVVDMQQSAHSRNITLTMEPGGDSVDVLGDRERLKQVMVNLIDNAIKYNRPDGRVVVSCRRAEGGMEVSVTDTGVGIPAEHLPRIFERFYRVDKERSREAGGTGLGLAIVKHIVEAHGGSIGVQSTVGSGSTFRFVLKT